MIVRHCADPTEKDTATVLIYTQPQVRDYLEASQEAYNVDEAIGAWDVDAAGVGYDVDAAADAGNTLADPYDVDDSQATEYPTTDEEEDVDHHAGCAPALVCGLGSDSGRIARNPNGIC